MCGRSTSPLVYPPSLLRAFLCCRLPRLVTCLAQPPVQKSPTSAGGGGPHDSSSSFSPFYISAQRLLVAFNASSGGTASGPTTLPNIAAAELPHDKNLSATKRSGAAAERTLVFCGGGELVHPRYLADFLPHAGGSAALFFVVNAAQDTTALVGALCLLRGFLRLHPANLCLAAQDNLYSRLVLLLRAKPAALLCEGVCAAIIAVGLDDDPTSEDLEPVGDEDACTNTIRRMHKWRRRSLIVDVRCARHVLLGASLWSEVPPTTQRCWMQALHGLLSEDGRGAWNANMLLNAGLLETVMQLVKTGVLVNSGAHLLAARLTLRVWHSVKVASESTQLVHDFLLQTLAASLPPYSDAAACPPPVDVLLLCLRMLCRMTTHLGGLLDGLTGDAMSGPAAIPHSGSRAVLLLLQPSLLLLFLHPSCEPRAVSLALRMIATLLNLSHNHPTLISFEPAFREAGGFDRLAVLLPLHAHVPDVYLPIVGLLLGKSLSLEQNPPPEDPTALQAACDSLVVGARPTVHWLPEALSVLSLLVREGLRIAASGATLTPQSPSREGADGVAAVPGGPGSQEESAALCFTVVRQQLQLCMAVLRALGALITQHPDDLGMALLQRIDVLQRLGSAIGVVWLYARNVADDKAGQGRGRATPGTIDTSIVVRILSQLLLQVVPRALGSNHAARGCPSALAKHLSGPIGPWQVLRGKGLATHGLQQLEVLLDPLPSLEHAGVPFRVWVEFRAQLLDQVTEAFQDRLADSVDMLDNAGLTVLSQLFTRTIQLQAWLGSVTHSAASHPDGPIADVAPQHELLGFLLLLLERRDHAAAGKAGTLSSAGAQHAAAVASQLVSWVRRTNIVAPDAMRLTRRSSGPLLELQEAALRSLLLRFASDVHSSSAVLLPLLGDVSMVVMTLVLRNPDQEQSLVPHRGLLLAICWKLFLLVEHADADVRNGATQNLKSLFSHTWFQQEAFGDSPLVFEVVSLCHLPPPARREPPLTCTCTCQHVTCTCQHVTCTCASACTCDCLGRNDCNEEMLLPCGMKGWWRCLTTPSASGGGKRRNATSKTRPLLKPSLLMTNRSRSLRNRNGSVQPARISQMRARFGMQRPGLAPRLLNGECKLWLL